MTTTYELYTNENGTPKAVEGKAPAIIERVEALETDVTGLDTALAGKAPMSHTHTKSQITDFPTIPDTSTLIPKTGDRGALAGYSTSTSGATVDASAKDSQYTGSAVTVKDGTTGQTWTKVVKMSAGTVTVGSKWSWVDGEAPELVFPCVLICHWNNDKGIAGIVKGAS